jgi:hypothetical protein
MAPWRSILHNRVEVDKHVLVLIIKVQLHIPRHIQRSDFVEKCCPAARPRGVNQ